MIIIDPVKAISTINVMQFITNQTFCLVNYKLFNIKVKKLMFMYSVLNLNVQIPSNSTLLKPRQKLTTSPVGSKRYIWSCK